MSELPEHAANIISAASESALGLLALVLIVIWALASPLILKGPPAVKVSVFAVSLALVAAIGWFGTVFLRSNSTSISEEEYADAIRWQENRGYLDQARQKLNVSIREQRVGSLEDAKESAESAIEDCRKARDFECEGRIHLWISEIERQMSEFDASRESIQKAISLFERGQNKMSKAQAFTSLGDLEIFELNDIEAEKHYRRALILYEQGGEHIQGMAHVYVGLADVYVVRKNTIKVREALAMAGSLFERSADALGQARALGKLAELEINLGNYDNALLQLAYVESLCNSESNQMCAANAWINIAKIHVAKGRYEDAEIKAREALSVYERYGSLLGRANCYAIIGEAKRSSVYLMRAADIFDDLGDVESADYMRKRVDELSTPER